MRYALASDLRLPTSEYRGRPSITPFAQFIPILSGRTPCPPLTPSRFSGPRIPHPKTVRRRMTKGVRFAHQRLAHSLVLWGKSGFFRRKKGDTPKNCELPCDKGWESRVTPCSLRSHPVFPTLILLLLGGKVGVFQRKRATRRKKGDNQLIPNGINRVGVQNFWRLT
jgi:hypothetical protein